MLALILITSALIMSSQLVEKSQESKQQEPNSQPSDNKTNQQANQTTLEITPQPLSKTSVEVAFPNLSFTRAVFLTYANDDTDKLFVVLQQGKIMIFPNKQDTQATVFLVIDEKVNDDGNEEGLLGLAFDPDYKSNGYFYVHYTANSPRRSVISRFSVSDNDPNKANTSSELVIMEVPQPYSNHNGGMIAFGPDRMLYIGLGDGGSGGDPHGNGQNRSVLLGKILRIDVSKSSRSEKYRIPADNPFAGQENSRGEIWAYGLRNPWRFSFDRATNMLWATDVGQDSLEEVNIIEKGANYGWNIIEGSLCYPLPKSNCNKDGLKLPVIEYTHADGCSITGGYVYRGSKLRSLYGAYIYGDFCSGKIWGLRYDGSIVVEHMELIDSNLQISSFGEDQAGELYILSFDNYIYRFKSE